MVSYNKLYRDRTYTCPQRLIAHFMGMYRLAMELTHFTVKHGQSPNL